MDKNTKNTNKTGTNTLIEQLKKDLEKIPEFNNCSIFDDEIFDSDLAFSIKASEDEIYDLRRYIHLNYNVSCLIMKAYLTDASCIFKIFDRSKKIYLMYHQLDMLYCPFNPQYKNVENFNIPLQKDTQHWDNIELSYVPDPDNDIIELHGERVQSIEGMHFVFTGKFPNMDFKKIKKLLKEKKATYQLSLNDRSTFLVVGDSPGTKYKTCIEVYDHNVDMINEKQFMHLLNLN